MKLVIKGAIYYDREAKTILIPHFTGEYVIVDCTQYILLDNLKDKYDESFILDNQSDPIEFEDETYYYAEYSPWNIDDWELLSDLSELHHIEEEFNF